MSESVTKEQVLNFIREGYDNVIKVDAEAFYTTVREKFKIVQNVYDNKTRTWSKSIKYLPDSQIMEILYFAKKKNLDPLMRDFYVFQLKDGSILQYLSFESYFNLFKQYVPSKYAFHIEEGEWINFTFTQKPTEKNPQPQPKTIKVPSYLTCVLKEKNGCEVARLSEYFAENFTSSSSWQDSPYKMLRSKVIAQTVRILLGDQGSLLDENDIEIIKNREQEEMESEIASPMLQTAEELLYTLSSLGINGFVQGDKVFVDKRYGHNNFDTLTKLGFVQGRDGCFYQKCSTSQYNNPSVAQESRTMGDETPISNAQEIVENVQSTPIVEPTPTPIIQPTQEEIPTLNSIENSLKESGIAFETKMKDGKCYLLVKEANDWQVSVLQKLDFKCRRLQTSGENVWAKVF